MVEDYTHYLTIKIKVLGLKSFDTEFGSDLQFCLVLVQDMLNAYIDLAQTYDRNNRIKNTENIANMLTQQFSNPDQFTNFI